MTRTIAHLPIDQKRALAGAHAIVAKQDVSRDGLTALPQSTVAASRRNVQ